MLCEILIVDDDIDDVEVLSEAFVVAGVDKIHIAESAEEAISILKQLGSADELPALIVTDHRLSGKSGAELAAELKATPEYQKIPVVLFSTVMRESDAENLRQMGVREYLAKPSSIDNYVEIAIRMKEKYC